MSNSTGSGTDNFKKFSILKESETRASDSTGSKEIPSNIDNWICDESNKMYPYSMSLATDLDNIEYAKNEAFGNGAEAMYWHLQEALSALRSENERLKGENAELKARLKKSNLDREEDGGHDQCYG